MPFTFTLTFRTTDPLKWGTGKGSVLTPVEVDENFWQVIQALLELQDNPALPSEIDTIDVVDNQMTITLTNATEFGPFTLPIASMEFTGQFAAEFVYKAFNFFERPEGLYLVLQDHTSAAGPFDPEDGNIAGPYYKLVIPYTPQFEYRFFIPGQPGFGITAGRAMHQHVFLQDVYFEVDFPGSVAILETGPLDGLSFPIKKNGGVIGSIDFLADNAIGTFALDPTMQFETGDAIRIICPTALDDDALDLTVSIKGRLGILPP